MDSDGSGRGSGSASSYFCLQCHVPQADTAPIVGNTFTPSKGYGNKRLLWEILTVSFGLIKRLWKWWRTPSRLALGTLLLIGFVGGIVFWGGFNTGWKSQYRRVLH